MRYNWLPPFKTEIHFPLVSLLVRMKELVRNNPLTKELVSEVDKLCKDVVFVDKPYGDPIEVETTLMHIAERVSNFSNKLTTALDIDKLGLVFEDFDFIIWANEGSIIRLLQYLPKNIDLFIPLEKEKNELFFKYSKLPYLKNVNFVTKDELDEVVKKSLKAEEIYREEVEEKLRKAEEKRQIEEEENRKRIEDIRAKAAIAIEKEKKIIEQNRIEQKKTNNSIGSRSQGLSVTIEAPCDDEGRLFHPIDSLLISWAIADQLRVEILPEQIFINGPSAGNKLYDVGLFTVEISNNAVLKDTSIKVWIVPSQEQKEEDWVQEEDQEENYWEERY